MTKKPRLSKMNGGSAEERFFPTEDLFLRWTLFKQVITPPAFHQEVGRRVAFGEGPFKQLASVKPPFERQILIGGFEALKIGRYLNEQSLRLTQRLYRRAKRLVRVRRVDQGNAIGYQC